MNSTGLIHSWSETPNQWGPLYPFVGYENGMLLACVLLCVGFLIWKFLDEHKRYQSEVSELTAARKSEKVDEP